MVQAFVTLMNIEVSEEAVPFVVNFSSSCIPVFVPESLSTEKPSD